MESWLLIAMLQLSDGSAGPTLPIDVVFNQKLIKPGFAISIDLNKFDFISLSFIWFAIIRGLSPK